jgi:hypothetical protein
MLGVVFWNCRGIKKKDLAPFIRDMIHEKDLDFLCFQETIMQDFPESFLWQVDPNKCSLGLDSSQREVRRYPTWAQIGQV